MIDWTPVEEAINKAVGISFDGCHKIYILMDPNQYKKQEFLGYGDANDGSKLERVISPQNSLGVVKAWFDNACGLRFVESVRTVPGTFNDNDGFVRLIAQGEDDD